MPLKSLALLATASIAAVNGSEFTAKLSPSLLKTNTFDPETIKTQMRAAADYFIAHEDHKTLVDSDWQHSAFLQGIMALYNATQDIKYKDYALQWGDLNHWLTDSYPHTLERRDAANAESCGQTYAELYLLDHNQTYIANIEEV